jgi:hypothetical protein
MLAGIQMAGGVGGLKKVDRSLIRDRSGAQVGGGSDTGPHGSGLPPAGIAPSPGGGGMADALALALQKRKEKVSRSGKSSPPCHIFPIYVACEDASNQALESQTTKMTTTSGDTKPPIRLGGILIDLGGSDTLCFVALCLGGVIWMCNWKRNPITVT